MLLLYLILFIKTDSSLGRIFIYKISAVIYKHNWLNGIGIGNFKTTYIYYQANYFKQGNFTIKEFLLADNTYFAFNDYFQFIIETGLKGIIILLFTGFIIYKLIVKTLINHSKNLYLLNTLAIMLAILIAAFFTYVFNKLEFQIIFITCLTIITSLALKEKQRKIKTIITAIGIIIATALVGLKYNFSLNYYFALKELKKVRPLERAGYKFEAKNLLANLDKRLRDNEEYLELNSYILTNSLALNKAEVATIKLIKHKASSTAYTRLGHIYEINNKNIPAENAYKLAVNMVPNRIISRYKLYEFYKKTGQKIKAVKCGKAILTMPIKVNSEIITLIKTTITNQLNVKPKNQK